MTNHIIYIADLDQDIDDCIAAEYLYHQYPDIGVVCDPPPASKEGIHRFRELKRKGIRFHSHIPPSTNILIVGGALTQTAEYILSHTLDYLFIQGGFVGSNIIPSDQALPKFRKKTYMRTYNLNLDAVSSDAVLKSDKTSHIFLIGKNICHDQKNTREDIWKDDTLHSLFEDYDVQPHKRLHDLLACHEALSILTKDNILSVNCQPHLTYQSLYPVTEDGLQGIYTKWGSQTQPSGYRLCQIATAWNDITHDSSNRKENRHYDHK